jgi:hypothetical protein
VLGLYAYATRLGCCIYLFILIKKIKRGGEGLRNSSERRK